MHGFDGLIFDVDGTLADTERDGHRPAFNAAFRDLGLDWEWSIDFYGKLLTVTGGKERILYYISNWCPDFAPGGDLSAFVADLHRRKTAHYVELLRAGTIPLRPGVLRLARQAREAGVRLGIATTTTPENVTALLACCGEPDLLRWFEVIAAGDSVPVKKPAPDIFLLALERLGLRPESCVAIEDSEHGVRAAVSAGLRALLVTASTYTRNQDFTGSALVVDGLGDPGAPVHLIAGALGGKDYIDLDALSDMHGRVYGVGAGRDREGA